MQSCQMLKQSLKIYKKNQIARNLMKHLETLSLNYDIIWPLSVKKVNM